MIQFKSCSVSVVIPFYNAKSTIELSLNSVFAQTILPLEIIIVNDASNNDDYSILIDILDKFKNNSTPIYLYSTGVNRGASFCRNFAITNAKGKYLAFLDADDVWNKFKLELQYSFMEKNDCTMSGHGYVFNLHNESFADNFPMLFKEISKWNFTYTNPFFTPTVMVLKQGFKLFDDSFRRVDDYKCWLENFEERKVFLLTSKLAGGFKHPIGSAGLTSSVSKMHSTYVLVLRSLYREKAISKNFLYFSLAVEFFKYPLRLSLKYFRKVLLTEPNNEKIDNH